MIVMLITFGVFLFMIAAMAIGVILSDKPLKGSCGGINSLGLKDNCPICGWTDDNVPLLEGRQGTDDLFYAAKMSKE